MKTILISGSSGFIAENFIKNFAHKYKFIKLSHTKSVSDHVTLEELSANLDYIKNVDGILNLAGANIATKRWSNKRKQELISSRVDTTTALVELANKYNPKIHFISASAIGIYPTDEQYDESFFIDYSKYDNFSQEITRKWEQSLLTYQGKLTIARFGIVLSENGGAFPKMLQPFKMFVGGEIGGGEQFFTWIAMSDLFSAIELVIENTLIGTYNLTAPQAIRNKDVSKAIAKIWHRPNLLPMPSFMVKLLFGQMGEELFLNSLNILPTKLMNLNFKFKYPDFIQCIRAIKNQEF